MAYFQRSVANTESTTQQIYTGELCDVTLYASEMTKESGTLGYDIYKNSTNFYNSAVAYKDLPLVSNVTYRIECNSQVHSNAPIAIFKIYDPTDTVMLASVSMDLYSASTIYCTYQSETFSLNYLPGMHTFRIRLDATTKNASSGGYYCNLPNIYKIRYVSQL